MSKHHDLTRPRFRIVGSKVTLESYGLDVQEAQLASGQLPGSPEYGMHPEYPNVTFQLKIERSAGTGQAAELRSSRSDAPMAADAEDLADVSQGEVRTNE